MADKKRRKAVVKVDLAGGGKVDIPRASVSEEKWQELVSRPGSSMSEDEPDISLSLPAPRREEEPRTAWTWTKDGKNIRRWVPGKPETAVETPVGGPEARTPEHTSWFWSEDGKSIRRMVPGKPETMIEEPVPILSAKGLSRPPALEVVYSASRALPEQVQSGNVYASESSGPVSEAPPSAFTTEQPNYGQWTGHGVGGAAEFDPTLATRDAARLQANQEAAAAASAEHQARLQASADAKKARLEQRRAPTPGQVPPGTVLLQQQQQKAGTPAEQDPLFKTPSEEGQVDPASLQIMIQALGGIPSVTQPKRYGDGGKALMEAGAAFAATVRDAAKQQSATAREVADIKAQEEASMRLEGEIRSRIQAEMAATSKAHADKMSEIGQKLSEIQTIDPNRVWSNASTGQKILTGIALAVGAWSASRLVGLGKGDATNRALKVFQDAIKTDIDTQVKNAELRRQGLTDQLSAENNTYLAYRQAGMDEMTAKLATEVSLREALAKQVEGVLARAKGADAIAAGEQLIAANNMEIAKAKGIMASNLNSLEMERYKTDMHAALQSRASLSDMFKAMLSKKKDPESALKDTTDLAVGGMAGTLKVLTSLGPRLKAVSGWAAPGAAIAKNKTISELLTLFSGSRPEAANLSGALARAMREAIIELDQSVIQEHDRVWWETKGDLPVVGSAGAVERYTELLGAMLQKTRSKLEQLEHSKPGSISHTAKMALVNAEAMYKQLASPPEDPNALGVSGGEQ